MIVILFLSCIDEKRETLESGVIEVNPSNVDNDLDGYLLSEDCDDNDSFINPGMIEVCDGVDNNCDGNIDENVLTRFYSDSDGDGYGLSENFLELCEAPTGYVRNGNDCDDTDEGRYPGAIEFCDGVDNNCNDDIDEELGEIWYLDADGDGFGVVEQSIQSCEQPDGYTSSIDAIDCAPLDPQIYPGSPDYCNDGIDSDCSPSTPSICYPLGVQDVESSGVVITGNLGSSFGQAITSVGDWTGDGYDDFLVGSHYTSEVFVFKGPLAGDLSTSSTAVISCTLTNNSNQSKDK